MNATAWKRCTILLVSSQEDYPTWVVYLDDGTCIGVAKEVLPEMPVEGEHMSIIASGSYVYACAYGEKVLWDYRRTAS